MSAEPLTGFSDDQLRTAAKLLCSSPVVMGKMQISPSEGLWTHYHFRVGFLSFDPSERAQLDRFTTPNAHPSHALRFVPVAEINKSLGITHQQFEADPELLDDPLSRSAVMNRTLIEQLARALENPEPGWFYDGN